MRLVDRYERPLHDLRISVTDRCNFRCTYCMPREHFGAEHPFLERRELLTYEEITTVVQSMLPAGLRKVRLTGGEPLLRKDLTALI
ncbi:MAG: radical SAM protein, partial [Candidatus Thermoplasmatota archaeon]